MRSPDAADPDQHEPDAQAHAAAAALAAPIADERLRAAAQRVIARSLDRSDSA